MQNFLLPATLIGGNLALRGASKIKSLPLAIRMASKSLAHDTTPFTEKDLTEEDLILLNNIAEKSKARENAKDIVERYGDWVIDTAKSTPNGMKQLRGEAGKAGNYDSFSYGNQTGTLPEHRAFYSVLSSEGIQPADYWNNINIVKSTSPTYAGNRKPTDMIKGLFNDDRYDMYHGIGHADYDGTTVTDRYDFSKLTGQLRDHVNPLYRVAHDALRVFGAPYDVKINLDGVRNGK